MATTIPNRTALIVSPHLYLADVTGRPLDYGRVYFGEPNKDGEFYPINIFSDKELTEPLAQPVYTKGGFLHNNGDITEVFAYEGVYSVKVLDQYGRKIFFKGEVAKQTIEDVTTDVVDAAQVEINKRMAQLDDAINAAAAAGAGANGWVDSVVKTENGETQREKNRRNLSIYDFFTKDELTAYKANPTTYDASKQVQAFFDYCHSNKVINANAGGAFYITKPINYTGAEHKTNVMYGDLYLFTDQPLQYMLHITGQGFQYLGTITLYGAGGSAASRKTRCGLLLGYPFGLTTLPTSSCYSTNLFIQAVTVSQVYDVGVYWGNFSHFASIGRIRGVNIGSCITDNSWVSNSATFSSVTTVEGDIQQSSTLTVDKLPYDFSATAMAYINGQMYNINSIDKTAKTITIYPRLPRNVNTGTIWYQQGSVLFTVGNDTSNLRVNTLQAITCGIGADLRALYGCNISTFISEYLGAGVVLTNRYNTTIGNIIGSGYFEANIADIVYGWASFNCSLPVLTDVALNPKKIISLYAFRAGDDSMVGGEYQYALGDMTLGNATYNAAYNLATGDLTNPSKVHFISFWGDYTLTLSQDLEKARLFAKASALYVFAGAFATSATGTITIKPPSGGYINNTSQITIDAAKYDRAILVYVYAIGGNRYLASVITPQIQAQIKNSVAYDPPSLSTATQQSTPVTLTGAKLGDTVAVSFSNPLQGTRIWAEVTAADTVTVYHRNDTGAAVDLASGTLTVKIV